MRLSSKATLRAGMLRAKVELWPHNYPKLICSANYWFYLLERYHGPDELVQAEIPPNTVGAGCMSFWFLHHPYESSSGAIQKGNYFADPQTTTRLGLTRRSVRTL